MRDNPQRPPNNPDPTLTPNPEYRRSVVARAHLPQKSSGRHTLRVSPTPERLDVLARRQNQRGWAGVVFAQALVAQWIERRFLTESPESHQQGRCPVPWRPSTFDGSSCGCSSLRSTGLQSRSPRGSESPLGRLSREGPQAQVTRRLRTTRLRQIDNTAKKRRQMAEETSSCVPHVHEHASSKSLTESEFITRCVRMGVFHHASPG